MKLFILMLSESGLSLVAVYKEAFISEVVYTYNREQTT
jgi:hypothetical protein